MMTHASTPPLSLPADAAVRGSNHQGMRQYNERIVLQAIRLHGPIPKADLARLTQLSTQTVSIITERLMGEGLLLKQARVRGKIGQPSIPLALNPVGAYSVGVQLGRRSMEVLLADFTGAIRHHQVMHYDYPDPDTCLPQLAHMLAAMQDRFADEWPRVVGVGLSAPFSMEQWASLMGPNAAAALQRWRDLDLLAAVEAMVRLPVTFARDTVAACTAELLQGHGQRVRSFLYVFLGTFVGGGLVVAGHLWQGPRGNAGAIGSLPMGVAQADASPAQLLELASGWQLEQALMQAGHNPDLIYQPEIMAQPLAAQVQPWLAHASNALAHVVTSTTALLDLDAIVIDGSVHADLLQALMRQTEQRMHAYSFVGIHTPRLLKGEVGPLARALGGALMPLHSQFFPDKDIFLKSV